MINICLIASNMLCVEFCYTLWLYSSELISLCSRKSSVAVKPRFMERNREKVYEKWEERLNAVILNESTWELRYNKNKAFIKLALQKTSLLISNIKLYHYKTYNTKKTNNIIACTWNWHIITYFAFFALIRSFVIIF